MAGTETKSEKGLGLRPALFAALFAASMGPTAIMSMKSYETERAREEEQARAALYEAARTSGATVSSWLEMNRSAMMAIGKSRDLDHGAGAAGAAQENYLKEMQKQYPWIYAFYMIDSKGMQYLRSDGSTKMNDVKERDYFKKMAAGEKYAWQVSVSKATGKPALLTAVPVLPGGKESATAYLGAGANMDDVSRRVVSKKIGSTGFVFLVGGEREYLAHPEAARIGKNAAEHAGIAGGTSRSDRLVYGEDEGRQIVTVAATNDDGLTAVGQMDKDEAFANMKEFERNLWIQLAASLLLSLAGSAWLGNLIAGGVEKVSKEAEKMSTAKSVEEIDAIDADLSKVSGVSEIVRLRMALGRLASSIKLAIQSLS